MTTTQSTPPVAPAAAWNRITGVHRNLDRLARHLLRRSAGTDVSLPPPDFTHPQTAFFFATIWMRAWYSEAWAASSRWLYEQAAALGHTPPEKDFADTMRRLRAFLVHHMDASVSESEETERICNEWFERACGSVVPQSTVEWQHCLARLLEQNEAYAHFMLAIGKSVERSPEKSTLVLQWRAALERQDYPRYRQSLQEAAGDLGLQRFNDQKLNSIHARYRVRWAKALEKLAHDADFDREIRLRAEWALLADTSGALIVSASDVMEALGLSPGPQVARALRLAQVLRDFHPDDSAEQLLQRLSVQWAAVRQ
ncbi:hypothetical protein ACFVS5_28515 [Streptomyces albidoflavus]|uniref:hypothetical protein n=1 Tax=Streptomyces koyangensis TaxID=188770 RepID=UPI0036E5D799